MNAVSARDRLTRLVDLASQNGTTARCELVGELADLLLEWPDAYPAAMREPFESLLERALRDVDSETRAMLAERFETKADTPLTILNLLVFDAAPETRKAILLRNASAGCAASVERRVNEGVLLAGMRGGATDGKAALVATRFQIPEDIAVQILADASGTMLAVLCRGAEVGRATFSALAVLGLPLTTGDENYRRLAAYDSVQQDGAAALLTHWRAQVRAPVIAAEAA